MEPELSADEAARHEASLVNHLSKANVSAEGFDAMREALEGVLQAERQPDSNFAAAE